jgi:hypothetical protein
MYSVSVARRTPLVRQVLLQGPRKQHDCQSIRAIGRRQRKSVAAIIGLIIIITGHCSNNAAIDNNCRRRDIGVAGDKLAANYSIIHHRLDAEQKEHRLVFDDRTLAELVRLNMAANQVYIPTAKSSRYTLHTSLHACTIMKQTPLESDVLSHKRTVYFNTKMRTNYYTFIL